MASTTFFFRAVGTDGKVRSGSLTADNDKLVARELQKQGLTPVYVGAEQKKQWFEFKLPGLGGGRARDVLVFYAGDVDAVDFRRAARPLPGDCGRVDRARALSRDRPGHFARSEGRSLAGRQPRDASGIL